MKKRFSAMAIAATLGGAAASAQTCDPDPPGSAFDLSQWKITLPIDGDGDGRVDEIAVRDIQDYAHPDFFYLDDQDRMVFTTPNRGVTTANSTNSRSELRHMLRGTNRDIGTHDPRNNFAVQARAGSRLFGRVGGRMEAALQVDHVALNATDPTRAPTYSVVVGQIHATRYDDTSSGFGYGNEPIKIFYKKWPGHETGSVFWTYELNLPRDNPARRDIFVPVFGNSWDEPEDPGENGIALGEEFSYEINVHENTMYVSIHNERLGTVSHAVSLISGVTGDDNPQSYGGDTLFFKAGAYNLCSPVLREGFWYPGCAGTGDWETDYANGDYARVTFSRLVTEESVPYEQTMGGLEAARRESEAENTAASE